MPRPAIQSIVLTPAERAATERAQRSAVRHSRHWRRLEIILLLDRVVTVAEVARRMRCQLPLVYGTRKRYLEGCRTPAALAGKKLGRPVSRLLEVLPLLRALRRAAGRDLFIREFRDALAKRYGIDLELSGVARYLKLGRIPTRSQRSNEGG